MELYLADLFLIMLHTFVNYQQIIVFLVLNGYFLQRGEISILTKEDKTRIALKLWYNYS